MTDDNWQTAVETSENGSPTKFGIDQHGWVKIEQEEKRVFLTPDSALEFAELIQREFE